MLVYEYKCYWWKCEPQSNSSLLSALCSSAMASNSQTPKSWTSNFLILVPGFAAKAKRAKCKQHWRNWACFLSVFEIPTKISKTEWKSMKSGPMPTQPRLMHIIQVRMFFCWRPAPSPALQAALQPATTAEVAQWGAMHVIHASYIQNLHIFLICLLLARYRNLCACHARSHPKLQK